jgi:hypothetical protein
VLQNVIDYLPRDLLSQMSFKPQQIVEFVWLDVACIDQRANELRSAAEIGRQAAIFNGAIQVFA